MAGLIEALTSAKGITAASLLAAIPLTWGGLEAMDTRYAAASEVKQMAVDIWYGQYYDRLDDYDEAIDEGREELAREYKRRMERLKAKICAIEPEWERCDN